MTALSPQQALNCQLPSCEYLTGKFSAKPIIAAIVDYTDIISGKKLSGSEHEKILIPRLAMLDDITFQEFRKPWNTLIFKDVHFGCKITFEKCRFKSIVFQNCTFEIAEAAAVIVLQDSPVPLQFKSCKKEVLIQLIT
jgi:hypothetical protein